MCNFLEKNNLQLLLNFICLIFVLHLTLMGKKHSFAVKHKIIRMDLSMGGNYLMRISIMLDCFNQNETGVLEFK